MRLQKTEYKRDKALAKEPRVQVTKKVARKLTPDDLILFSIVIENHPMLVHYMGHPDAVAYHNDEAHSAKGADQWV